MTMTPRLFLPSRAWRNQPGNHDGVPPGVKTFGRRAARRGTYARFQLQSISEADPSSSACTVRDPRPSASPPPGLATQGPSRVTDALTGPPARSVHRTMGSASTALTQRQLAAALRGDGQALAWIIDHLTPVIQARLTRLLLRHTSAHPQGEDRKELEDLVQEVFLSLFADGAKVLHRWDPERGASLLNYVGLVAERHAISLLRARHRWLPTEALDAAQPEPPSEGSDPENEATARQSLRHLLDRLQGHVSPLGWNVFRLLFVEERSVADIETEVGLSSDAVYAWRSRLRKLARRLWLEMHPEPWAKGSRQPSRKPQ